MDIHFTEYIKLLSSVIENMASTLQECAKLVDMELSTEDIIQQYLNPFSDTTAIEDYLLKQGKITSSDIKATRENFFAKDLIALLTQITSD